MDDFDRRISGPILEGVVSVVVTVVHWVCHGDEATSSYFELSRLVTVGRGLRGVYGLIWCPGSMKFTGLQQFDMNLFCLQRPIIQEGPSSHSTAEDLWQAG